MIHVTSAFVQPGVASRQVLEISNVSGHPLELVPGVRLCQLVLMRTEGHARYRGRFADQEEPEGRARRPGGTPPPAFPPRPRSATGRTPAF